MAPSTNEQPLDGRRVAFVATDGVESVELAQPWAAVSEAGAVPTLLSLTPGRIQSYNHLEPADVFDVDQLIADAHAEDFDGLVLPGGVANPDRLRTDEATVAFVRAAAESGTPIGVICHGPWTLIEADQVDGRRITSWPSLHTDLENAGANWVDEQVVVCDSGPNVLVSSRKPDDLDAFCEAVVDRFADAAPSS